MTLLQWLLLIYLIIAATLALMYGIQRYAERELEPLTRMDWVIGGAYSLLWPMMLAFELTGVRL